MSLPKVVWDNTLPPMPVETEEQDEMQRWKEWFTLVGMEKEWQAVTDVFPDNLDQQRSWAMILESNRINAATRVKIEDVEPK